MQQLKRNRTVENLSTQSVLLLHQQYNTLTVLPQRINLSISRDERVVSISPAVWLRRVFSFVPL
jgi:hypothetical protein